MEQGISYYRKKKGLTQKKLASLINVTPQSLSLYERGSRKIPLEILKKISKQLEVPENELSILKLSKKELLDSILSIIVEGYYSLYVATDIAGTEYDINNSVNLYLDSNGIDSPDFLFAEQTDGLPKTTEFLKENLNPLFTESFIDKLKSKKAIYITIHKITGLPIETLDDNRVIILACIELDNNQKQSESRLHDLFDHLEIDTLLYNLENYLDKNNNKESKAIIDTVIKKLIYLKKALDDDIF